MFVHKWNFKIQNRKCIVALPKDIGWEGFYSAWSTHKSIHLVNRKTCTYWLYCKRTEGHDIHHINSQWVKYGSTVAQQFHRLPDTDRPTLVLWLQAINMAFSRNSYSTKLWLFDLGSIVQLFFGSSSRGKIKLKNFNVHTLTKSKSNVMMAYLYKRSPLIASDVKGCEVISF